MRVTSSMSVLHLPHPAPLQTKRNMAASIPLCPLAATPPFPSILGKAPALSPSICAPARLLDLGLPSSAPLVEEVGRWVAALSAADRAAARATEAAAVVEEWIQARRIAATLSPSAWWFATSSTT